MARPARVTQPQILEAARLTFLELGASAPLSAIAARLGVNRYLGGNAFAPGDDASFLTTLLDAFFKSEAV